MGGGFDSGVDNHDDRRHSFTVWAVCTPGAVVTSAAAAGDGKRAAHSGQRGPRRPRGAPGDGSLAVEYVKKAVTQTANFNKSGTVKCPAGKHAISGGVRSGANFGQQWITDSAPSKTGGWTVSMDTFGAAKPRHFR